MSREDELLTLQIEFERERVELAKAEREYIEKREAREDADHSKQQVMWSGAIKANEAIVSTHSRQGLTKREQYAGAAMSGMLSAGVDSYTPDELAARAFMFADAMLAAEKAGVP